jgi:hypothetical protein
MKVENEERKRKMQITSQELGHSLVTFFEAMNSEIDYVVLRNYEGLPTRWGNDIDILLREEDMPRVQQFIDELIITPSPPKTGTTLERWNFWSVNLCYETVILQIDLYSQMSKAWWVYADVEYVLEKKRLFNGLFYVPLREHELLLLAAKELFSYGKIRPRYHGDFHGYNSKVLEYEANAVFKNFLSSRSIRFIAHTVISPYVKYTLTPKCGGLVAPLKFLQWLKLRRNIQRPGFCYSRTIKNVITKN